MLPLNDVLIFAVGFLSAFVGSVSAGSGLIGVPALLLLGFPPHVALGTFNVGDLGSKVGNVIKFSQHKNLGVSWKDVLVLTLIAVPATALGAAMVVSVDPTTLSKFVGVILIALIPLLFVNRDLGVKENRATGTRRLVSHLAFFITRVWGGFFSPGSGLMETYVRMRGYGYTLLQGKAVTRIPDILAGIGGITIFALSGFIDFRLAAVLFLGMLLGGFVGTGYAIQKGNAWLKPILGLVIVITAIKMIFFS